MEKLNYSFRTRRALLRASWSLPIINLAGCVTSFSLPTTEIREEVPTDLSPIFRPVIRKSKGVPSYVIDVHAHFFNARDVPIKGYICGPVAHSKEGPVGDLLRALAPIAEWIGNTAPRASVEFHELISLAKTSSFSTLSQSLLTSQLTTKRNSYLNDISRRFYKQLNKSPEFIRIYNSMQAQAQESRRLKFVGMVPRPLDEGSLFRAMQNDFQRNGPTLQSFGIEEPPPYADGILAFVGYMLSYRWMNLLTYQQAFSTGPDAFGVDQVLGALVDFDHWLNPPPKTAHEDQIKLHQLLSVLSGGYMRPLVSYNPWSDIISQGKSLKLALEAIDHRGFVGVKIYPPNGFRPLGNTKEPNIPITYCMPTPAQLDMALLNLWTECGKRNVPVMAHAGNSMGSDDAHNRVADHVGWKALIDTIGVNFPARVNLGHFGGDSANDEWNAELAKMMAFPQGSALYGDIGYWDGLRCKNGNASCVAHNKLADDVKNFPVVATRLMYGSDWLMFSKERRWDQYPFEVLAALPDGYSPSAVFGGNAKNCFPKLLMPTNLY